MDLSLIKTKLNRSRIFASMKFPASPEEKKELVYFLLLFLLFSAAAVTSVGNFWWLNTSEDEINIRQMPQMPAGGEINARLSAFSRKYDIYTKYRNESRQLVDLAETFGKYPVALLPKPVAQEFAVPEFAPQIKIRALVVMGSGGVATLDIENETPGMIVKPGTTFGGGKGKITAIDPKGVSWTWANKKYRTDL